MRVMVPPIGTGVTGVNARVTDTLVLPTTRSKEATVKVTDSTRLGSTMPPDDKTFDNEQVFNFNRTPTEPAVAAPIVNPLMVIVIPDALKVLPDIVIVTAVEEVALQFTVKPATLLKPAAKLGVTDVAKKLDG